MGVDLLVIGYFIDSKNFELVVVLVLVFLAFFEFSTGPIFWIYIAETCTHYNSRLKPEVNYRDK
jgi:hypothetical protein